MIHLFYPNFFNFLKILKQIIKIVLPKVHWSFVGICRDMQTSNKNPANHQLAGLGILFRGPERIRTAVGAFAELCLATRPQDL